MEGFLSNFSSIIASNVWIALVLAFFAGIVSSFSPCTLSTMPLVLAYVGGNAGKDKKLAFRYSLVFSVGLAVTFTILGAISAILGKFMSGAGNWWYYILGAIMIIVGLQMLGVIGNSNKACKIPNRRKGLVGAFFLGILGGALASPCATPVLAAILAFVAGQGNVFLGIIMLLLYSAGYCTIILIAGTSVGVIEELSSSPKYIRLGKVLKIVFGIIVILLGLYILYLGM